MDREQLTGLVQLHAQGGQTTSRALWWKLEYKHWYRDLKSLKKDRKYLQERKYAFPFHGEYDGHLPYLCTRAQRGMMSYHKCSVKELRKFCKTRGLHVDTRTNWTAKDVQRLDKDSLRRILEYSDEHAKFTKFLDLPPELRLMVYEYSFDVVQGSENKDWREKVFGLEPPPIASVSKLLRREVLPQFYAPGKLTVNMTKDNNYREPREITELFGVAPLAVVEAIKNLEIVVSRGERDAKNVHIWNIRLQGNGVGHHISLQSATPTENKSKVANWLPRDQVQKLHKAFNIMLCGIKPKESGKAVKLKRSDIYLIRKAVQDTLNK